MRRTKKRIPFAAFTLLAANIITFGQPAVHSTIEELNVRAAMSFLASDAMQGRGSGTVFERIAGGIRRFAIHAVRP